MSHPKKNQTVKLYSDAACTEKMKVDFKGWGKQNKFCFKANWIDITHARNIVSARLWGDIVKSRSNYNEIPELLRTSPNQGAIDGFPVKVYANGVYQGRYTINIPKDAWMSNMDDDLDNHCILCGESNVDDRSLFRAQATIDESDWTDEVHDTVPESIKTRWNEAINFVVNSSNDEFVAGINDYFDLQSLIDYYLFGVASCGFDAYGKNQLFMTYDGQKWFVTMYDMDSTWGLWWDGSRFLSVDYSRNEFEDFKNGASGNLLYIRLATLFSDKIKLRWNELKYEALSAENILNRFEEFINIAPPYLVEEDYAATTADGKFTGIPSNTTNNIQQVRKYVVDRLSWCDSFINNLSRVPSDYTTVLFVQSNGMQYIDTEISGGTNAEYEIRFDPSCSEAVGYEQYFGGAKQTAVPKLFHDKAGNHVKAQSTEYNVNASYLLTNITNNAKTYCISYTKNGEVLRSNEVIATGTTSGHGWGNISWYIFANHEEGLMSSMRLFGLKMWTNGELVREFIPVVRNIDGVAGLYDVVSDRFFKSNTDNELFAFSGLESDYRPSMELPDGYTEFVIDETSGVSIPVFGENPSAKYGMTHIELVVSNTDFIPPDILYMVDNTNQYKYQGTACIYSVKTWNDNWYLSIALPTDIIGETLEEVNAWLSEHNIIFYRKIA